MLRICANFAMVSILTFRKTIVETMLLQLVYIQCLTLSVQFFVRVNTPPKCDSPLQEENPS